MVFSSLAFLFLFLPTLNITYFLCLKKTQWQNFILMLFSLAFYYWGEKDHIFIMIACIFINYSCGILIESTTESKKRKFYLVLSITASLLLLLYFKYFNFFLSAAGKVFHLNFTGIKQIALPLGISFYTFHSLSYVIDVYWKKVKAEFNFVTFVCYVSFFPQLVAGPIVRYSDIRHSFYKRYITQIGLRNGISRFCFGLAKKVLIANEAAKLADYVFYLPPSELSFSAAWLGTLAYTLQIYFDFSGYSDMAIGLGLMFGFKYKENFNFPYTALSIQEFWRKWHISLSTWFRDYLYIPLGGSYVSLLRTQINLLIVFSLCGLWHGASKNFVIWGLFHGFFLILERTSFAKVLKKMPIIMRHTYVLFVVCIGWVFFREDHFGTALRFIKVLFMPFNHITISITCFNRLTLFALVIGFILSLGFNYRIKNYLITQGSKTEINIYKQISNLMSLIVLLLSILLLSTNSYNPFLYFRF